MDGNEDSHFIPPALNQSPTVTYHGYSGQKEGQYGWRNGGSGRTFTVTTPGLYEFRIRNRESGFSLDRIVFSQTTNLTELFKGGYKNVDDLDYPDYGPPLSEPDSDKVSDGDDNELTQEERSQILDMLQRFEALQQKLQAEKLDEMRAARGEEEDEGKSELTPEEQWDQMYLEIMAWLERNGTNAEVEELLADILAQRAMARGDDSD